MSKTIFTGETGVIRFYDATPSTPFYLEIPFSMGDLSAPMGIKRPEDKIILARGDATVETPQFIPESDEKLFDAIAGTLSARVVKERAVYMDKWFDGLAVNSHTILDTLTSAQVEVSGGSNVSFPAKADAGKFHTDLYIFWSVATLGIKFPAARVDPGNRTIKDAIKGKEVMINLGFQYHGKASWVTAFPTGGVDVTV